MNTILRQLEDRYGCAVWEDKEGNLHPIKFMNDRRVINCQRHWQAAVIYHTEIGVVASRGWQYLYTAPPGAYAYAGGEDGIEELQDISAEAHWRMEKMMKWVAIFDAELQRRGLTADVLSDNRIAEIKAKAHKWGSK